MDIVEAIRRIDPLVSATVKNNEYDTIEWLKGGPIPKDQIDAEIVKLKAEYDAKQYQRDRQYPSIQDQLDMQYWDRKNGTKTWEESIDKVKADNPKPE
tara:strand:- start:495 stop:788 length:294 start_codon:yes stop_codon:yes gene_type:complete